MYNHFFERAASTVFISLTALVFMGIFIGETNTINYYSHTEFDRDFVFEVLSVDLSGKHAVVYYLQEDKLKKIKVNTIHSGEETQLVASSFYSPDDFEGSRVLKDFRLYLNQTEGHSTTLYKSF